MAALTSADHHASCSSAASLARQRSMTQVVEQSRWRSATAWTKNPILADNSAKMPMDLLNGLS
jgi:hypothetical protein